jgi:phosphoenolpyruvate-protein kinase (PTS system EI component)
VRGAVVYLIRIIAFSLGVALAQTPAKPPVLNTETKMKIYKAAFERKSIESAMREFRDAKNQEMQEGMRKFNEALRKAIAEEQALLKPYEDVLKDNELSPDLEFKPKAASGVQAVKK